MEVMIISILVGASVAAFVVGLLWPFEKPERQTDRFRSLPELDEWRDPILSPPARGSKLG